MPFVEDFISRKKANWEQLNTLLQKAQNNGLKALSAQEINDLGRLYRSSTSDLAVARRDYPQHQVSQYLNDLVARSHSTIYSNRGYQQRNVGRFFTHTFPQTFRQTWIYTLISFLMFLLPALYGYINAYLDPFSVGTMMPGIGSVVTDIQNKNEWWLSINDSNSLASAEIMTNNISVAIKAFAGGILFGIYTFYILYNNGLMLGIIAGASHSLSFADKLWGFVAAHGTIELSVIFIAGGAGMQLGWALLRPGLYTRETALYLAAQRAIIIIVGCIPLLVIAGLIEGFISPSSLPNYIKYGVSIISGILLYGYLILAGREPNKTKTTP